MALLAPMIGARMLSQASDRVLSSYPRKVLFFAALGLVFAVFGDLMRFGIGSYPLKDALVFGANHIVVWFLVGLVAARLMKPGRGRCRECIGRMGRDPAAARRGSTGGGCTSASGETAPWAWSLMLRKDSGEALTV